MLLLLGSFGVWIESDKAMKADISKFATLRKRNNFFYNSVFVWQFFCLFICNIPSFYFWGVKDCQSAAWSSPYVVARQHSVLARAIRRDVFLDKKNSYYGFRSQVRVLEGVILHSTWSVKSRNDQAASRPGRTVDCHPDGSAGLRGEG